MSKISVIIPVFNMEKYLAGCLESILSQSLADLEILCVNDGSTDSTLEILQKYSERDRRIKVFSQSNQGAGPAKNVGLREAAGEFVAFMDADDFYHDDSVLERLYELAVAKQVSACGGGIKIIKYKNDNAEEVESISFNKLGSYGMIDYRDCQRSTSYTAYIFSRQLIRDNDIFFPDTRRGEDYIWCIRALLAARVFWSADFVVYVYRQNHKPSQYPYNIMLDMIEAEIFTLRLACENNLDKIRLYHQGRLLKHSRELALSDSSLAEISQRYPLSFVKYYTLKLLSKILPGKPGRSYRDRFLAYKPIFNIVRHHKLYF